MDENRAGIVLLGIGNILFGDEGVGVHAINEIKQRYSFSDDVEIIDGGTMGLDLLPFIEGRRKILIVDAVNFGKPAGTIGSIEGDDIPIILKTKLSVHQIGLPDMLSAASVMGIMPEEICLVGIQPKTLEPGVVLSDDIRARFDLLVNTVLEKLNAWGVRAEIRNARA